MLETVQSRRKRQPRDLAELAAAEGDYRTTSKARSPVERCCELARAGCTVEEIESALASEGRQGPLPVPMEVIERERRVGVAYLRHALHLMALSDPHVAAFVSKNVLGYTASALDREMASHVKQLTTMTKAQLRGHFESMAARLGLQLVEAKED